MAQPNTTFQLNGRMKIQQGETVQAVTNQVTLQGVATLLQAISLPNASYAEVTHIFLLSEMPDVPNPEDIVFDDVTGFLQDYTHSKAQAEQVDNILTVVAQFPNRDMDPSHLKYKAVAMIMAGGVNSDSSTQTYEPSGIEKLFAIAEIPEPITRSTFLPINVTWRITADV